MATRDSAVRLEQRVRQDQFTVDHLREQLDTIRRMGPLDQLVGMIPGMNRMTGDLDHVDQSQLSRTAAIIDSMTPGERRRPVVINDSRRKRIARGSGTTVEEVNRLLKQFTQMRKMLKDGQGDEPKGQETPLPGPLAVVWSGQMLH